MRKNLLIILIIVIVIVGSGLILFFVMSQSEEATQEDNSNSDSNLINTNKEISTNSNTAISLKTVKFTHEIFDTAQVSHITPLGELNGGYIESQSFAGVMINLKRDANDEAEMLDLFAPTNMELLSYSYHDMLGNGDAEWALVFRLSDNVSMTLDHVREAGEKIISATTSQPKTDSRRLALSEPVKFEAGEYIARTDGTSQAHNWNIYVYDDSTENQFAVQERYTSNYLGREMLTATCFFDYYSEAKRAPYQALYGYAAAGQSATCGTVARDSVGSIAGLWYFSDTPSEGIVQEKDGVYATPLAVYTASNDTVILHEIDGQRFDIFSNNSTYKIPEEVTSEHCYGIRSLTHNSPVGYAYFRMIDDYTMELAYSSNGSWPDSFPESISKTYYR